MANLFDSQFWDEEAAAFWSALLGLFVDTLMDGIRGGVDILPSEFSLLVDFDLVNENAVRMARDYRYEWVSKITDTTRTQVQDLVSGWIRSGAPLKDLEAQLSPIFGKVRAEMIAATEVTRVFAMANEAAWKSTGFISSYKWMTAQDDRVCPICSPRAMKEYKFDSGEHPPAHVRCRCWEQPIVDVEAVGRVLEGIDFND